MFNLEISIAEWRQQMLAAGIQPAALEELESHLREELERQTRAGVDAQQAFESAAQTLGTAPGLVVEFGKDGILNKSKHWILTEITIAAITGMVSILLLCMAIFQWGTLRDATTGQWVSCLAAAIVFVLATWGVRFGYGFFPVIGSEQTRNVAVIAFPLVVMAWWGIFFRIVLPHWDLTMSQLTTCLFWNLFVPGGLVAGLGWGMAAAFRKKNILVNS